MGPIKALFEWALYLAPTLIAWYRKKQGQPVFGSIGQILVFNLLLGWTVVVWFLMLANAFGYNPVAWFVLRYGKKLAGLGSGAATPGRGTPGDSPSSGTVQCTSCGGSGSESCSQCQGRGSWYDPPVGEHGVAQLRTCNACTSSGRVRCHSCGGTGTLRAGF